MISIIGVIFYFVWTKKIPALFIRSNLVIIPPNTKYNKFKKNSSLQHNLENVIVKEIESLEEEFKDIETIDQENINPAVTFKITKANSVRNRYKDMVPYDNNIAKLKVLTGQNCPVLSLNILSDLRKYSL